MTIAFIVMMLAKIKAEFLLAESVAAFVRAYWSLLAIGVSALTLVCLGIGRPHWVKVLMLASIAGLVAGSLSLCERVLRPAPKASRR